jgi:hypothetical protein
MLGVVWIHNSVGLGGSIVNLDSVKGANILIQPMDYQVLKTGSAICRRSVSKFLTKIIRILQEKPNFNY